MLAVGSQLTVHTKKRRLEADEPDLAAARPFLKCSLTTVDHEATSNDIITFVTYDNLFVSNNN